MASATATSAGNEPVKIERHVWVISGVVILGMIMSILDTTIVNVALDRLSSDLHSTISEVQWVVTGYLLALAAVMPVTGWAARRWGAKRVYLVSLVLFTLGSVACGLSNSLDALVVFRVLQGIGGGMIMPLAQLIMAQVAGPRRMGRVMGVVSMPAMLAPIFGPVIGAADPPEPALVVDLLRQRADRRDRLHPRLADAPRHRLRRGGTARPGWAGAAAGRLRAGDLRHQQGRLPARRSAPRGCSSRSRSGWR